MRKIVLFLQPIFCVAFFSCERERLPGWAADIGIGSDSSIFVIGTDAGQGDGGVYHWQDGKWIKMDGAGMRIAVDPQGKPWVVNKMGHIFKHGLKGWEQLSGGATDIGIGSDGSVFIVGTDDDGFAGPSIYQWQNGFWTKFDGFGVRIAVDAQGSPWVVNRWGVIHRCGNSGWERLPGEANDIGIGADGSVFIVGRDDDGYRGGSIYKWEGDNWVKWDGAGISISVNADGKPWVVDRRGSIYRFK